MKRLFRIWYQVVTAIAALLALTAATYAWFTSNKSVSTSTAVTRTGDQTLELQISEQGEGAFQSVETASISQVNGTDAGVHGGLGQLCVFTFYGGWSGRLFSAGDG